MGSKNQMKRSKVDMEGAKSVNLVSQDLPYTYVFACPHANIPVRSFKISKLGLTKLMMS